MGKMAHKVDYVSCFYRLNRFGLTPIHLAFVISGTQFKGAKLLCELYHCKKYEDYTPLESGLIERVSLKGYLKGQ
jgi:hypothetical protein